MHFEQPIGIEQFDLLPADQGHAANLADARGRFDLAIECNDVDDFGKAISQLGLAIGQAQDAELFGGRHLVAARQRQQMAVEHDAHPAAAALDRARGNILDPLDHGEPHSAAAAVQHPEQQGGHSLFNHIICGLGRALLKLALIEQPRPGRPPRGPRIARAHRAAGRGLEIQPGIRRQPGRQREYPDRLGRLVPTGQRRRQNPRGRPR